MILTGPLFLLALALTASGASLPSEHLVRHEARDAIPSGWIPVRRAPPDVVLPLRVGLVQQNLENLETYLLDVSDPESPHYGEHWSTEKVAETFRPSDESVQTVRRWLVDEGIHRARIRLAGGGGWLEANVTVAEAEHLLRTEYEVYDHASGASTVACPSGYYLPEHVARHVDFITPTLHFDTKVKRGPNAHSPLVKQADNSTGYPGKPGFGPSFPKTTGKFGHHKFPSDLSTCDQFITPDCLRALYNYRYTPRAQRHNSIGIVEYTPQAYLAADLDYFFTNFSKKQIGERPKLVSVDGGYAQTDWQGFGYNGESNLDLQYAMALVGKSQPVTLYQVGDTVQGASFNTFLDAIDGSYCKFDGGDDSWYDPIYPDPYGGYNAGPDCGIAKPAYVISTSYTYDETSLPASYTARQCAEYGKLGLMGVTVLYSSGDYGVAGYGGWCMYSGDNYGVFVPSFPGGCPYITSVGATQIAPGAKVSDPEVACEDVIYSGGGFSNQFRRPSYQKDAVAHYLKKYPPPYPDWQYNKTSRAFPDISANGADYLVAVQGEFWNVFGTSCSSPVLAALFTAINDARLSIGKRPIGFINPALYSPSFKDAFHDIVSGTNPGCGTPGFNATPGWDPVTGLGTPNFQRLLQKFLWLR